MQLAEQTTFNKIIRGLWLAVKVMLVLIYGCGFYVEKAFFALFRLAKKVLSLGWFQAICNIGEWVLGKGGKIAHGTARFGHVVAHSFVNDFSWWAPCIGLVAIIGFAIVSNFFAVALEVSINENSVGYVTNERTYRAILGQVESDIQKQIDQNASTDATIVQTAPSKEESDQSLNVTVSATQKDDDDDSKPTLSSLNLDGESYAITTTAEYSLRFVRKSDLATEEDLYGDVYNAVSELVGTNWGLYVDGELQAACSDRTIIDKILDELKAPYENDEENTRIEFVEDVVIKRGMFSSDVLKDETALRAMFETDSDNPAYYTCKEGDYMSTIAEKFDMTTSQLKALNPNVKETAIYEGLRLNIAAPELYLRIKTVKTETYNEEIGFSVKRENNASMYVGTTSVKTAGKKGVKRVTAEVTYVDGQRTGKKVVSSKVIEKPVDKVIYVGTKKRATSSGNGYVPGNHSQGSGVASGNFTTPLPGG